MATATATKRKLVLKMSVSLDGFVAGPNGEVDWIFRTSGGGDSTEWVLNTLRGAGVHIMGSRSYYDMAAFWPFSDMPIAPPMNDIPKIIFSRKGIKDGAQADRTTRALAEARARNAERLGVTPTEAVLQCLGRTHGGARRSRGGNSPTEGTAGQFHPCAWRRSVRPKPRCLRPHRRISTGHSSGCTGPRPTAVLRTAQPS